MLVDINLLYQKEKKKPWALLTVIICLVLVALLLTVSWIYYQSQMQKVDQLNRELTANEELRKVYENSSAKNNQTTPTDQLSKAIHWAQVNRKETYVLLQHLISLLPERGFISDFSFQAVGTVILSVQFDTTRQAADFLHHLQTSSYMKNTELQSIDTNQLEENVDDNQTELPRYQAKYQLDLNLEALLTEEESKEVNP